MADVKILYDGDCPICSAYAQFTRLRQRHHVEIVDGREARDHVTTLREQGVDIDEGMIVLVDGEVYHGDEAVAFLEIEGRYGVLRSASWIRRLYPWVWRARNALLRMLGRDPHVGWEDQGGG